MNCGRGAPLSQFNFRVSKAIRLGSSDGGTDRRRVQRHEQHQSGVQRRCRLVVLRLHRNAREPRAEPGLHEAEWVCRRCRQVRTARRTARVPDYVLTNRDLLRFRGRLTAPPSFSSPSFQLPAPALLSAQRYWFGSRLFAVESLCRSEHNGTGGAGRPGSKRSTYEEPHPGDDRAVRGCARRPGIRTTDYGEHYRTDCRRTGSCRAGRHGHRAQRPDRFPPHRRI